MVGFLCGSSLSLGNAFLTVNENYSDQQIGQLHELMEAIKNKDPKGDE